MECKMSYKGYTIYTNNCVTEDLVQSVKDACEKHDWVHVSFDVIGRTMHVCLAHELVAKLRIDGDYEANIDYDMYECAIRKVVE